MKEASTNISDAPLVFFFFLTKINEVNTLKESTIPETVAIATVAKGKALSTHNVLDGKFIEWKMSLSAKLGIKN